MKKIPLVVSLLIGIAYYSNGQSFQRQMSSMGPKYDSLINKDIATAMTVLNIKDTVGKTEMAFIPQVEKGVRFLVLNGPNGDKLAFKENRLRAIFPSQKKR